MTDQERPRTPAYLWFDAEFSSLDLDRASLLQVAMLVTDSDLKRLTPREQDVDLHIALAPDTSISEWVRQNQADTLAKCRSAEAVSLEEADRRLAALVDTAVGPRAGSIDDRPIMAGNSVIMKPSSRTPIMSGSRCLPNWEPWACCLLRRRWC